MSLNRAHIQYVLNQFDAGASPHRILDRLQNSAFLPWLKLATVEQCLRENGRITYYGPGHPKAQDCQSPRKGGHSSYPLTTANQGAAGLSATTQEVHRVPADYAVRTIGTDAPVDPGPTESCDALADRFIMSAYLFGHSVGEIWAKLRNNGYHITEAEIKESLNRQRVPIAE